MASEDTSLMSHGAGQLAVSDQEVFTFQDDSYHSDFKQRLKCMRDEDMLTDVTLKAGNATVKCHKVALAAASPYFYRLFKTDHAQSTITLDGVSPKVLEPIVDFVYIASLELRADFVKELSQSCEQLQLTSLKKGCDKYIAEKIEPSNSMGLNMFARRNHLDATLKATEKCMFEQPEEVLRLALNAEYQELSEEALIQWISNDDVMVPFEDVVFKIVENWVHADSSRNKENTIANLLNHVRLPLCNEEFLVRHVRKSPLIQYTKCRQYMDDAFDFLLLKSKGLSTEDMEGERTKPRKSKGPILVLVGGVSNGTASNQCWGMQNGDQQWEELPVLPPAQQQFPFYFRACAVDDGIVVTGGCSDACWSKFTAKAWFYNLSDKRWSDLPQMSKARAAHAMVVLGSETFVFGGYDQSAGRYLNSAEKLDPQRQNWTAIKALPHAVNCAHGFHISDDIYVISGHQRKTQKYTINADSWQVMADMPAENCTSSMIKFREDIFVLGGQSGAKCMRYSTKSNTWTYLASPQQVRCYGYAVECNDKIVLIGGGSKYTLGSCLSTAVEYNPHTDQWSDSTLTLPKALGCYVVVNMK